MALASLLLVVSAVQSKAGPLLWPLPQSYSHGTATASLDPKSFFGVPPTPMLERAFARYSKIIFAGCDEITATGNAESSGVIIRRLEFNISAPDTAGPAEHMDEWYELEVPVSGPAVARARTQWGALRALETFSQAVESCTITGLPLAIADAPRFTHRGLLLDMARVWWSMDGVKGVVDAMQFSKLNVLHLHLTDSEAFPVETSALNATRIAFDPKNGCRAPQPSVAPEGALLEPPKRCTYSQADLRSLVSYAADRGIRVIPEFDMPAHTSWARLVPGISINCSAVPDRGTPDPSFYIDPLANASWHILETFLAEMASVFPEKRMHLGTDEVFWRCYNASSAVQAAILTAGKRLDDDGLKWIVRGFIQRAQQLLARLGKSSVVWNEGFDLYGPGNFGWEMKGPDGRTSSINSELASGTAVEFWEGNGGYYYNPATGRSTASNPQEAIAHGQAALATGAGWYLPMGPFTPSNWSSYLENVYNFPVSTNSTCVYTNASLPPNCTCFQEKRGGGGEQRAPDQEACWDVPSDLDVFGGRGAYRQLLGGEGCLWGVETHPTNGSNVHKRAWPGGLAIAERLWSARSEADWQKAAPRLEAQMHRLKQRGVPVAPMDSMEL